MTLIWNDNNLNQVVDANEAVAKRWLQVTVKATAATGLTADQVFYFGNAVGECGNSPANASVSTVDATRVTLNVSFSAALNNPYDYNRDGKVASADRTLVINNLSTLQPLLLLDLRGGVAAASALAPMTASVSPLKYALDNGSLLLSLGAELAPGSVRVFSAETVDATTWEAVDVVPVRHSGNGHLEFRFPVNPDQPQRFYRFKVVLGQ